VEKGIPKGPDVLLYGSERTLPVYVLDEHTLIVAFRVGSRNLV
jgi:hypothetical protein